MVLNRSKCRAIFALLIIFAFFVPAYHSVSAFQFLFIALSALRADNEVTFIDLLVVLLPLLSIPLTALFIFIRTVINKPLNVLLLNIPFFSVTFFFLIFSLDMNRQSSSTTVFDLLPQMRIGFYLATLASLLLIFSYSREEAMDPDT